MLKFFFKIKYYLLVYIFIFTLYYSFSNEEINILSENDLYEIAEIVSFVYFQAYDLKWNTFRMYNNYKITKENIPTINGEIMKGYRSVLYKNSDKYVYSIDTIYYPIINEKGLTLFNTYYFSKKINDYEKCCLQRYKMAIDKYGKLFKLFGFGNKTDDFELLYQIYFYDLKSEAEVYDLIQFYIYNVLFDRTGMKFIIIDNTNIKEYNKYYSKLSKPFIKKENGIWTVKLETLIYSSYMYVELIEFQFNLNENHRKFTFTEKLIKKYKNLEDE